MPVSLPIASAPPVASLLRREPYRLFMPLGVLLGWAGVAHWLLHALGLLARYQSIFHGLVQIQGFLMAFAVGFLMTAVPKRTGTWPATTWQIALAASCLVGTTVAAWYERWALSQVFWLVLAILLLAFVARRARSARAKRRLPVSFVWVPFAFAMGIAGSVLAGVGGSLGGAYWELHELGRGLVLQGMFLALVVGVGSFALPLMTRGDAPADATRSRSDRLAVLAHVTTALALTATFWIERAWPAPAHALRGTLVLGALWIGGGLARPPTKPGANRKLLWVAACLVPTGYFVAALFPAHPKAGLHVTFIGGLALLATAVGAHVVAGHGGRDDVKDGRPWPLVGSGALLLGAMVPRALVDFDPGRFFLWLGVAAGMFLMATALWLAFSMKLVWPRDRTV